MFESLLKNIYIGFSKKGNVRFSKKDQFKLKEFVINSLNKLIKERELDKYEIYVKNIEKILAEKITTAIDINYHNSLKNIFKDCVKFIVQCSPPLLTTIFESYLLNRKTNDDALGIFIKISTLPILYVATLANLYLYFNFVFFSAKKNIKKYIRDNQNLDIWLEENLPYFNPFLREMNLNQENMDKIFNNVEIRATIETINYKITLLEDLNDLDENELFMLLKGPETKTRIKSYLNDMNLEIPEKLYKSLINDRKKCFSENRSRIECQFEKKINEKTAKVLYNISHLSPSYIEGERNYLSHLPKDTCCEIVSWTDLVTKKNIMLTSYAASSRKTI